MRTRRAAALLVVCVLGVVFTFAAHAAPTAHAAAHRSAVLAVAGTEHPTAAGRDLPAVQPPDPRAVAALAPHAAGTPDSSSTVTVRTAQPPPVRGPPVQGRA